MPNFFEDRIKHDARYDSTARIAAMDLMPPFMVDKIEAIIRDARAHGLDMMVFETYRSQDRQKALFDQGATKLRKVGVHHYGLACDIVKNVAGEPSWKGDFSILGHLARAHNLIWGGDWGTPSVHHTFLDDDHVQFCSLRDQARLFRGDWYPDENYNPYDHL